MKFREWEITCKHQSEVDRRQCHFYSEVTQSNSVGITSILPLLWSLKGKWLENGKYLTPPIKKTTGGRTVAEY